MKHLSVALFLMLAIAAPAIAAPEDMANDIAAEIMSPYCPGVTLHDCPSAEADQLRARITGWAEAGWSKARIMAQLESEFGSTIRATPTPEGGGLTAWALPLLAVLLGSLLAALLARRWTEASDGERQLGATATAADAVTMTAEDRRRLDAELGVLRSGG